MRVSSIALASMLLGAFGTAQARGLESPSVFASALAKARAEGYGLNPPDLRSPSAFCGRGKSCAPYCDGSKPIVSKIEAAMAAAGLPKLVDPAAAVQDELRKFGCNPQGGSDVRNASANCGIAFKFKSHIRKVQPSVVKGLVRAALEAGSRGYSIIVGSTFRSAVTQTKKVCKRLAKNPSGKQCGRTIACPGGSNHGMGFAIDVALVKNGKMVTPIIGEAHSCKSRKAKVRGDKYMWALMDVMLSSGWSWYCQELWHFDHSSARIASRVFKLSELGKGPQGSGGGGSAPAVTPPEPSSGGSTASKATDLVENAKGYVKSARGKAKSKAKSAWGKTKSKAKRARGKVKSKARRARGKARSKSKSAAGAKSLVGGSAGTPAWITSSSTWMRSRGSSKSEKVSLLRRCAEVRIVGKSYAWREVVSGGERGHVYWRNVSTTKPSRCR